MTIPVYVFTGFLESGKTTLIKDTLQDPGFQNGEKNLLLLCEEGIEEYDDAFLTATNTSVITIANESDLTYPFMKKCDSRIEPDRVLIEFNGTWNLTNFINQEMPFDWLLVQILSTIDASTFEMYVTNMRSLLYEQLVHSETIIFNRCDEKTKKLYLRNNIKAINKTAQIIYESVDGSINNLQEDELPFDLCAEEIKIEDQDYGLWYMDALEHPAKYDGKRVIIKAKVISSYVKGVPNAFVLGRYAMVCCADDTSLVGLLCHYQQAAELIPEEWVEVHANIAIEYDEEYEGDVPILYADEVVSAKPAAEEFVYFT